MNVRAKGILENVKGFFNMAFLDVSRITQTPNAIWYSGVISLNTIAEACLLILCRYSHTDKRAE